MPVFWSCFGQIPPSLALFAIFERIFFRLEAMAKKENPRNKQIHQKVIKTK